MKKLFFCISAALLSLFSMNAQVVEGFEGNSMNWQEYSSSRREAVIKEGVLHMKSSNQGLVFATCIAPIDCSEPFKIKTVIKDLKLNADDKGIVVVFNYGDNYNNDQFRINKETIEYIRFAENKAVKYRDADFKLNKKLKVHEVVLQYRNRKAELYIDDVQCLEVSPVTMNFNGYGYAVFGDGQEADIESVEFRNM